MRTAPPRPALAAARCRREGCHGRRSRAPGRPTRRVRASRWTGGRFTTTALTPKLIVASTGQVYGPALGFPHLTSGGDDPAILDRDFLPPRPLDLSPVEGSAGVQDVDRLLLAAVPGVHHAEVLGHQHHRPQVPEHGAVYAQVALDQAERGIGRVG